MLDLHTHTFFSDGVLLPSELVRRAYVKGYRALAITDHVDSSNMDFVVPRIASVMAELSPYIDLKLIPGAEITHVPPQTIQAMVAKARELGAKLVVMHGETLVEPVAPGTNRAAIDAGIDVLAHPGLITKEDASRAKEKGVFLEITTRKGHSLSNGHVADIAMEVGADLVVNTDTHSPGDLVTAEFAAAVLRAAGLKGGDIDNVFRNSEKIAEKMTQ